MPGLLHPDSIYIDENNVLHEDFICDYLVGEVEYDDISVEQALLGNGNFCKNIEDVCANCILEYVCDM